MPVLNDVEPTTFRPLPGKVLVRRVMPPSEVRQWERDGRALIILPETAAADRLRLSPWGVVQAKGEDCVVVAVGDIVLLSRAWGGHDLTCFGTPYVVCDESLIGAVLDA